MAEFWDIAGAGAGTIFTGRRDPAGAATAGRSTRCAPGVGRRPTSLATYAAVQVWAQAAERAGTPDPAAVTEALHRGRFETVLGRVTFDGKGDLEGAAWRWQVWRNERSIRAAQARYGANQLAAAVQRPAGRL